MLSLPGIKGLMRSFDPKKRDAEGQTTLLLDADLPEQRDQASYLVWLATYLQLELLALVEVPSDRKSATVTVAGKCGLTSNLTIPALDDGGPLSKLILRAVPAGGRAKIFVTTEAFPCDGNWCDLIPMDSTIAFFFMPTAALPLPIAAREVQGEGPAGDQDSGSLLSPAGRAFFVLAADTAKPESDHALELKACLAAGLVRLSMVPPEPPCGPEILGAIQSLLEKEGYAFGISECGGQLAAKRGSLFEKIGPERLSAIRGRIDVLATNPGQGENQGQVAFQDGEDLKVRAYTLAKPGAGSDYLIVLRSTAEQQDRDFRREWLKLLGRFTSSVAHEIKNPLTGIAAGIQYLAKRLQPGVTEEDTVDFILTEIARLNRIVDDLYKIARPPQLVPKRTSINDVIAKSLFCLSEDLVKKRLHLEQRLENDIPEFEADPERLQQVLINIIKNAIEAANENGRIEIATSRRDPYVEIRVKDNGPGISATDRERIFEPFYSTKKGGTGLGLCVSQAIIEEHGGRIRVEQPLEGGASLVIELPLRG